MIRIPLEALTSQSEEGEAVNPEVGDSVALQSVEGKVTGIEGDTAHVEVQTVNGAPVEYGEAEDAKPEAKGDEEEMLRAMAEAEDEKAMR